MQVDEPTRDPFLDKTEAQRLKLADEQMKQLGVRGRPLFADLSYFKCAAYVLA